MPSEVEICNLALQELGESKIDSFTEASKSARLCAARFNQARDETLQAHPWNFAIKRADLAQLTETPAFGYDHYYALPADYLSAVSINDDTEGIPYKIETAADGTRVMATDEDSVSLRYIWRNKDTGAYSPQFVKALSQRLAADLAYALTRDRQLAADLEVKFERSVGKARVSDAQADYPDQLEADEWLNSR